MLAIVFSLLTFAACIWIMVIAIQNGDIVWGIISLICGIVAIIYGIQHFDQCKVPLALLAIGVIGNIVMQVMAVQGAGVA